MKINTMGDEAETLNPGSSAVLISDDLQAAMAKLNTKFFFPNY